MSLASATGQVIFSQKGGVYMPSIQCNQGLSLIHISEPTRH